MFIREMSIAEFKEFANTHFIGNFHESINYALIKAEEGFEYEFIAYGAEEIVGAALILYKKIGNVYFGYSPRGFLIDYSNDYLLEDFTNKIKEYYKNRNFAFIKINPEIAVAKLNKNTMNFEYNENYKIDCLCEPQLGRRGLYPTVSQKGSYDKVRAMTNFIAYADGKNDLIDISNIIGEPIDKLIPIIDKLIDNGLLLKY